MKRRILLLPAIIMSIMFFGCKKDDDGPDENTKSDHIVGATAAKFTEATESNNNTPALAEPTAYVLDTTGLVITGSFEASTVSNDYYKINTGTFSNIDVQVFVNNITETEASHKTTITLDAFENDGYSSLMGSGYFISAWVNSNKDWVVGIFTTNGAAAGLTYTIELKGTD